MAKEKTSNQEWMNGGSSSSAVSAVKRNGSSHHMVILFGDTVLVKQGEFEGKDGLPVPFFRFTCDEVPFAAFGRSGVWFAERVGLGQRDLTVVCRLKYSEKHGLDLTFVACP